MEHVDVVIIGAGVAGLSAALELHKFNEQRRQAPVTFLVLEAGTRVGGRLLTDDDSTDLGGAYIGRTQLHLKALCAELGVGTYELEAPGDALFRFTPQEKPGSPTDVPAVLSGSIAAAPSDSKTFRFDGLLPSYSDDAKEDFLQTVKKLDELAFSIPTAAPETAPNARELDNQTIAHLVRSLCRTHDAEVMVLLHMQAVHATDPNEVSALAALWFVHCAGGVTSLLFGEEEKFVGGAQQLPIKLAERVGLDRIRLNSVVRRIEENSTQDALSVHYESECGEARGVVVAKRALLAIPPAQSGRIIFRPPLPAKHQQSRQLWPMGTVLKTFTFYERPFWRDLNLSGRILDQHGVAIDVYDDSKTEGPACLMGLVTGRQATHWGTPHKTSTERHEALQQQYHELFDKHPEALRSIGYKEKEWAAEPFIAGGFAAVARPGTLTRFGRAHCEPLWGSKLAFATTETATVWMSYIEGAMLTARQCAVDFIRSLVPDAAVPEVPNTPIRLHPVYAADFKD